MKNKDIIIIMLVLLLVGVTVFFSLFQDSTPQTIQSEPVKIEGMNAIEEIEVKHLVEGINQDKIKEIEIYRDALLVTYKDGSIALTNKVAMQNLSQVLERTGLTVNNQSLEKITIVLKLSEKIFNKRVDNFMDREDLYFDYGKLHDINDDYLIMESYRSGLSLTHENIKITNDAEIYYVDSGEVQESSLVGTNGKEKLTNAFINLDEKHEINIIIATEKPLNLEEDKYDAPNYIQWMITKKLTLDI